MDETLSDDENEDLSSGDVRGNVDKVKAFFDESVFFHRFYNLCCKKFTYVEIDVNEVNDKKWPETEMWYGLMRFMIPLRAFFCWMIPVLAVGCWKITLTTKDLPQLSSQYKCSHYLDKFKSVWGSTKFLKKIQLPICLYLIFGLEFGFAAFLKIIATGFQVMIPFFLSFFLHEFHPLLTSEERADLDHYRNILPNNLKPPTGLKELGYRNNDGMIWVWLFCMVIAQFFGYLFTQNSYYFSTRVGGKMRVLLGALITEKVYNIRSDRIHESKHPKGEVLNFFATDAFMVDYAHWFILDLLSALILVAVAVYFLSTLIGISAIFVFLTVAVVLISVTFLTTCVFVFRRKYFKWMDRRITRMRESFYNIKIIKWFQWEDFYRKKILGMRSQELCVLRMIFVCLAIVNALGIVAPPSLTVAGFGHFFLYNGYVDVINLFSASSYFLLLRIPIISFAQNSIMYFTGLVSMLRIQTFLQEPDRDESGNSKCYKRLEFDSGNPNSVEIENGSFVWSHEDIETLQENKDKENKNKKKKSNKPFCLKDINVEIPTGKLIMIVGKSGSGKTSFLNAMLGEMIVMDENETHVFTNGNNFAYCQQPPWIQNVSLKENIIFTQPYEEEKLKEVIQVCQLQEDFHKLEKDFERMEIGEAGSTVSSGQRSRISLARACYSDADVYFMDNVLANLDTYVAARVFEDCVMKYLGGMTRIMVTKKLHLCSCADLVLVFDEGRIVERGTFQELREVNDSVFNSLYLEGESEERLQMNSIENILDHLHRSNFEADKKKKKIKKNEEEEESESSQSVEEDEDEEGGEEILQEEEILIEEGESSNEESEEEESNSSSSSSSSSTSTSHDLRRRIINNNNLKKEEEETTITTTTKYKITEKEERVIGILPIRAICSYLCFGGGCCVATFVLIMYGCSVTWYFIFEFHIGNFAEQLMYHQIRGTLYETQYYLEKDNITEHYFEKNEEQYYCLSGRGYLCKTEYVDVTWDLNYNNGTLLTNGINNHLSLGIYALATVILFLLVIIESSIFFQCFISRSQRMFKKALNALFSAPVVVFDRHPIGRLISRLSYDVASLENETLIKFDNVMNTFYVSTIAMIMVCVLTSGVFVPVLVVAVILYVCIYLFIRKPTMELKRLEAVSRSPLFATFSQTVLEGRESARAYGVEDAIIENTYKHIDYHNRSYYLVNVAVRTLEEYLNIVSVLLVFFAGMIAIIVGYYFPDDFKDETFTDPFKDLGMGLTFAISLIPEMFPISMSDFVYGETKLNAIERLEYYANKLKKEPSTFVVGRGEEKDIFRTLVEKIVKKEEQEEQGGEENQVLLKFEDVKVRYQPHLPWVLKNLNFEVERNQRIGIVGKTGSGKTSILLALTRIVMIEGGRVSLSGRDIQSEIKLKDLRKRISVLPAHPILFQGTILSNLDPLNEVKDREELWDAIEKCGGTQLVKKNGGLRGPVDEQGDNFSEGEKQILSLIRCVVKKKDTEILIIDEYSSTMDDKMVEIVQESIENLDDITILSISHNLKRVIHYDKIMVLDEGEILEFDTPKTLLEDEESLFFQMVQLSPDRDELHRIVLEQEI